MAKVLHVLMGKKNHPTVQNLNSYDSIMKKYYIAAATAGNKHCNLFLS